jgi:hypothetical protein
MEEETKVEIDNRKKGNKQTDRTGGMETESQRQWMGV